MPKKYSVRWEVEAVIEVDDEVIDRVDDEWREHLYDLQTESEIMEHIAHNLLVNRIKLSSMDGWADMDDSKARIVSEEYYQWDTEPMEVT